jgi:aspartate/glutamate racemase
MLMIGMLGGMSWESSAQYYRLANELVRERLGDLHSARCLLYSVERLGGRARTCANSHRVDLPI